jgi:hypothetical protein
MNEVDKQRKILMNQDFERSIVISDSFRRLGKTMLFQIIVFIACRLGEVYMLARW